MIVNRLEANKERFRPEGFNQHRPHSIRSLQFDRKVRPLSFRPKKFDLFTATLRLKASVCIKNIHVEASRNHAVVCAKLKGRHMRHRLANDMVKHSLAEVPSTLEPSGLCISNAKRPDGLTLLPYSRGKAGAGTISSPAIWATIWRRSHGRQKCRPNGLIKLSNVVTVVLYLN